MLLSEALLLLLLDERKGSSVHAGWAHDEGLAGAVLLDLLAAGALTMGEDDKLVATSASPSAAFAPSSSPALTAAAAALSEPTSARKAVGAVVKALKPIKATIAGPLVAAGVLDETRHRTLGLFPSTRYPELDPTPETRLRAELRAVLVSGQAPSEFVASLLSLLVPMELVTRLVDRDERKPAAARAKAVAESGAVGDAVKAAVQRQIAGVVAAGAAAAAASASSAST
jgi:hypothetical protein